MKPAPFGYTKAKSVDHAIALLMEHAEGARLIAGGQSLVATLNMRLSAPHLLIDIGGLENLKHIAVRGHTVEIGALVRHADLERSAEIARHVPLFKLALPHIAHPAIRNRGTIGGSLAYADPAAELPACLLALGAEIEIIGVGGRRAVGADGFFTGLFETALGPHDVLTSVHVPVAGPDHRCGFAELARRHGDFALVGLAAAARAAAGRLKDVRLAFFGVGPTALRARAAEAALEAGSIDDAVDALANELRPDGNIHASAAAKQQMAGVLLRRVVQQMEPGR